MNRVMILLGALAVAGVLVGCGQQSPEPPAPTVDGSVPVTPTAEHSGGHSTAEPSTTPAGPTARTITITVRGGQVSGDTGRVEVPLGTPVTVAVTSDVADEIHVHGYNLTADVPAGESGSVDFTATIPGVFEVELEGAHLQLFELQVS